MVKTAREGGWTPAAIGSVRWGCLSILLFTALQHPRFRELTRAKWPSRRDAALAVCLGLLLFGPSHLIYYVSLGRTSSIEAAVLGTTAPVWTAAMAFIILRERVAPLRAAAIAVGFVGAWVVSVGFTVPELRAGNTAGNLLYLSGVLTESAAGVLAATLVRRSSGIVILAFQVFGAALVLAVAPWILKDAAPFAVSTSGWAIGAVAYLTLVPGFLCFGVWYMLVERTPLSLMVLSILLQPPLSALLGWLVLGESLTTQIVSGTVLITIALVLAARESREHAQTARQD